MRAKRQADGAGADRGRAARAAGPPDPDGARGSQAARERPPAHPARPGGRGQGVPQPGGAALPEGWSSRRRPEAPDPAFDRAAYRERNVVERLINRLKQWRRIATRYEKRAVNYLAMLTVAALLLWL